MQRFTPREIAIIKKNYPRSGKKMFDMLPDHTPYSILGKAKILGIKVICREIKFHIKHDDALYLAAIIDGEGSIGLWERTGRERCYNPHIAIYNTNHELIKWVESIVCPIPYRIYTDRRGAHMHKISYNLAIRGIPPTYALLRAILPYLKIKNRQANLVLEFDEARIGRPIRQFNSIRDHQIYATLRSINQKGVQ
jgi:hypothetical protein